MKPKTITILVLVTILFYFVGHYIGYGSFTNNCIYTEKQLSVPKQLTVGEIVVVRDAYVALGRDGEYSCLKEFGNISREIVGPESINNVTVGRRYFTERGLTVQDLNKGVAFRVVGAIAITKHGISTIDSGSGSIDYLILKDNENVLYQVATVLIGTNSEDLFLAFVDRTNSGGMMPTTTIKFIDFNTFSNFGTPKDPNSLVFTGKFVELQAVNVEEKKPEWKKLSDRLQKGEHFLIMVDIDLLDDEYNPVTLSDNESKRAVQVTQLQNDLLNKIPKNIELKDVEKNIAWPYVSMQANLPLLTYLVDNRAILKIKSMSELHKMP